MTVLAVIGVGHHARRSYLPALAQARRDGAISGLVALDVPGAERRVRATIAEAGLGDVPLRTVPLRSSSPRALGELLDGVRSSCGVDGVVISTEPLAHRGYLEWCISRGVPAIVDKPVLVEPDLFVDPTAGERLAKESVDLVDAYRAARARDESMALTVSTHRRYNPLFRRARSEVIRAVQLSGCHVTSVLAEHCDGEWRSPRETVEQDYHTYGAGYGAMGHSGYHVLDAAVWLAAAGRQPGWADDVQLDGFATGVTVAEHVAQVPPVVTRRAWGLEPAEAGYGSSEDFSRRATTAGEVDAHAVLRLSKDGPTEAVVSVHVQHMSWSTRTWPSSAGRDLYLGNGRVSQETYVIQQGPIQTLRLTSWQHRGPLESVYDPGGPRDYRLQVFRHPSLGAPEFEEVHLRDVERLSDTASTVGPGKELIVSEFLDLLRGKRVERRSDLEDHLLGMRALGAVYAMAADDRRRREVRGAAPW